MCVYFWIDQFINVHYSEKENVGVRNNLANICKLKQFGTIRTVVH